jgi:hypothetical protein
MKRMQQRYSYNYRRVKLVEVSSDGEKDRIYETREDLRSPLIL